LNPFKRKAILDEAIAETIAEMSTNSPDSEEYKAVLTTLERLVRLQNEEKTNRVSPDTMAIVAANLASVVIVVGYERGHIIVSRALNFLLRTKLQ
jgi:hypothetical protein